MGPRQSLAKAMIGVGTFADDTIACWRVTRALPLVVGDEKNAGTGLPRREPEGAAPDRVFPEVARLHGGARNDLRPLHGEETEKRLIRFVERDLEGPNATLGQGVGDEMRAVQKHERPVVAMSDRTIVGDD